MEWVHTMKNDTITRPKGSKMEHTNLHLTMVLIIFLFFASAVAATSPIEWTYEPRTSLAERADPPIPTDFAVQLLVDDDNSEGDFGVGGTTAQQFLWFNRFTPGTGSIWLEQIWVLFPSGPNMEVGAPVELVVYQDADDDPANGAALVATFDVTIQAVDGNTFSVYEINPPLWFHDAHDVLIGVVDRFVVSGTTSATRPAALDTTASQGRSWLAVWSDDPPSPPDLPADGLTSTIDPFVSGNWMIRAFGHQNQAAGIPAQNRFGLALLIGFIASAGFVLLLRARL